MPRSARCKLIFRHLIQDPQAAHNRGSGPLIARRLTRTRHKYYEESQEIKLFRRVRIATNVPVPTTNMLVPKKRGNQHESLWCCVSLTLHTINLCYPSNVPKCEDNCTVGPISIQDPSCLCQHEKCRYCIVGIKVLNRCNGMTFAEKSNSTCIIIRHTT